MGGGRGVGYFAGWSFARTVSDGFEPQKEEKRAKVTFLCVLCFAWNGYHTTTTPFHGPSNIHSCTRTLTYQPKTAVPMQWDFNGAGGGEERIEFRTPHAPTQPTSPPRPFHSHKFSLSNFRFLERQGQNRGDMEKTQPPRGEGGGGRKRGKKRKKGTVLGELTRQTEGERRGREGIFFLPKTKIIKVK